MDWNIIIYFIFLGEALVGYMTVWFFVSIFLKRNDVADIAWGLGFVMLSWLSLLRSGISTIGLLVTLLVTVWGVRLAWHIFKRNIHKPEDERYRIWRETWRAFYVRSFFQIYIFQGVLLFIIAFPVVYINYSMINTLGWVQVLGLAVWGTGFVFESIGDSQLKKFVHDSKNKGNIMDQGLWRYTRHPNYFGEVVLWWGIYLMTLSLPYGFVTAVGPITITGLILFVSGIPLLEKKYASNDAYQLYKKRTSIFFPWWPRKL